MSDAYIEQHDGAYIVAGTRVSLDSIVYGAITYYLAHPEGVDRYLESRRLDFDAARQAARDADPMFYQKLTDAKRHTPLAR